MKSEKRNCEKYRKPFEVCAMGLLVAAEKLDKHWPGGMDYKKINVILFCVIMPGVFAVSLGANIVLLKLLLRAK